MTKLETVKKALEANPNAIIVAVQKNNYLPKKSGFWSHTVDFIVAPKSGLYTANELQEFMMGLIPLEPTSVNKFGQIADEMHLGTLFFDEQIGTEKRIITLADKELFNTKGFQNGQMVVEDIPLKRRIWVSVYPDKETAQRASEGGPNKYWISLQKLKESQLKQVTIIQK